MTKRDFFEDILPKLTSADAVILLGCAAEPSTTGVKRTHSDNGAEERGNFDGVPSSRLWALVPQCAPAGCSSQLSSSQRMGVGVVVVHESQLTLAPPVPVRQSLPCKFCLP